MCLILFSYNDHPKYKLILAANRDEFYKRPTAQADYWEDHANILAGRDLVSKGTWLGLTKQGRFIAITNFRNGVQEIEGKLSRGNISQNFLTGDQEVQKFKEQLALSKSRYNGYNVLFSDSAFDDFEHYSNISDEFTVIGSGVHGLSNALLDTEWPKVKNGKVAVSDLSKNEDINPKSLIELLNNPKEAPDQDLPNTNISYELEKKLSPVFISMNEYGTRCSTALLIDHKNKVDFLEVSFDANHREIGRKEFHFNLEY